MSAPETQRAGLVEQLKAAIDEDERIARATMLSANDDGDWMLATNPDRNDAVTGVLGQCIRICMIEQNGDLDHKSQAEHIARFNPKRALEMAAAHREILAQHSPERRSCCPVCWRESAKSLARQDYPCPTLRALAEGYGIEVQE